MSEKTGIPPLVSAQWLAERLDDPGVRIVEIAGTGQEEKQKYRAGHIPGALCWWWKDALWDANMRDFPAPDAFARLCAENGIGNDTTVVFYGEGVQFGVYAWWAFTYCGHDRAAVLDGARYAWAAEGRPLTTDGPVSRAPVQYREAPRVESMRVRRDDVLRLLGEAHTLVLDGRSPEEYRGERVGGPGGPDVGAVRYGRVPGAKHVFFNELLTEDKRFKPVEQLKAIFGQRGAGADRNTVTYCRLSHRATVLYFALTQLLGLERVRVYDGSWIEWGNLVGVPVER